MSVMLMQEIDINQKICILDLYNYILNYIKYNMQDNYIYQMLHILKLMVKNKISLILEQKQYNKYHNNKGLLCKTIKINNYSYKNNYKNKKNKKNNNYKNNHKNNYKNNYKNYKNKKNNYKNNI